MKTFSPAFYLLSLPWSKNSSILQEAENTISRTSRTIKSPTIFVNNYVYIFGIFLHKILYNILISCRLLEKAKTCYVCMISWE